MDPNVINQINERIRTLQGQVQENAAESARYLVMGEYSSAAAEAHRAHQRNLLVRELQDMVSLHG